MVHKIAGSVCGPPDAGGQGYRVPVDNENHRACLEKHTGDGEPVPAAVQMIKHP